MSDIINAHQLPEEVQNKFVPYLKKLLQLHKEKIVSVFIYGSSTGPNYSPNHSDINSVFIVRDHRFDILRKSLQIVGEGLRQKIAAPLFLTKEYIQSSLDVFPMEFGDMKENHLLVFGEDVLSSLDINEDYVRLFCEQQIKGKLLRIRQAYLTVGLNRKGMETLLKDSLNSLIPIFRNLLRLKGKTPPPHKMELIKQIGQEFGLKDGALLSIYKHISGDEKLASQNIEILLEKYIDEIEKLAGQVDQR